MDAFVLFWIAILAFIGYSSEEMTKTLLGITWGLMALFTIGYGAWHLVAFLLE